MCVLHDHGSGVQERACEIRPPIDPDSARGLVLGQRVEQQFPRGISVKTNARRYDRGLPAGQRPLQRLTNQRPLAASGTADVDHDRLPRFGRHVTKRVRQPAHGHIDDRAQITRIGDRLGAHRHSDLLLVMPELCELATDVEPTRRQLFTRPRHSKQCRRIERQRFEPIRRLATRPLLEVGKYPRTEPLRRVDPLRVQGVDKFDEVAR